MSEIHYCPDCIYCDYEDDYDDFVCRKFLTLHSKKPELCRVVRREGNEKCGDYEKNPRGTLSIIKN